MARKGKGWRRAPDGSPREPSGRLQRPRKDTGRISEEDLRAGIYPDGDVRNQPAVRERMLRSRPVKLPSDLPAIWVGPRTRCASCGALRPS